MMSQPQSGIDKWFIITSVLFIIFVPMLFVIPILILSYVATNAFTSSSIQSTPGDVLVFVGTGLAATSILAYVFFEISKWIENKEENHVIRMIIIIIISVIILFISLSMATTALYLVTGSESYLRYALGSIIGSIDADVAFFSFIAIVITSFILGRKTSRQDIYTIASAFQSALAPLILYEALYGISLSILRPYYQTWLSIMISNTWFKPIVNSFMLLLFALSPFNVYYIMPLRVSLFTFLFTNVIPIILSTEIIVFYNMMVIMQSKEAGAGASVLSPRVIAAPIIRSIVAAIATSYITNVMAWLILGAPSIVSSFFYVEFLTILALWFIWKYRNTRVIIEIFRFFTSILLIFLVLFDVVVYGLADIVVHGLPINVLSLTIRLLTPHIVNFALSIIIINHWFNRLGAAGGRRT